LPVSKIVGDIDDEGRLFYVALTRGKKEVNILYPKMDMDGRETSPSGFLEKIGDEFLD
jgi:superfamily I DNA/RNA helicase